jgi:ABC-type glycerol-3-phosphate transport system substrate-binding protein
MKRTLAIALHAVVVLSACGGRASGSPAATGPQITVYKSPT